MNQSRLVTVSLLVFSCSAWSQAKEFVAPAEDVEGSSDPQVLKRYEGSVILSHYHVRYDEFTYPLSKLKIVNGKRDAHNNRWYEPEESLTKEGPYTRVIYLTPEGRSPLEVLRNYQREVVSSGGKVLYECKETSCGGDATKSSSGGGGHMSLSLYLFPEDDLTDDRGSPAWCVTTEDIKGQRYMVAQIPGVGSHVSIFTYQLADTSWTNCRPYINRTIAIIDLVEGEPLEEKMVVVESSKMRDEIATTGSISLYGIYFDVDEVAIKEESQPTIQQIANLLTENPSLRLRIVGHTDNQGSFDYNRDLSQQRAQSVVNDLVGNHAISGDRLSALGASYSSPVASNRTEEGRVMNRRVTLVEE
jgi:outer membrane protein OmpA-like peptidoglycan-associated protein